MDKPFSCPMADCNMTFTNEDHLTVHRKKHELSLTLTPTSGFKNLFVDQTPTPTRFLTVLESDLFQDFQNDNPFDATFRKANSSNGVSHNFVIPDSSLIASLPDSEVLNTPSITLPSEPETPITLKPNFSKKIAKQQDNQSYNENTDTLPFTPGEQSRQDESQHSITNEECLENANVTAVSTTNLSILSEAVQRKTATRTSVVQTPVITSVGNSTVLKANSIGVPTAVVVSRPPTNNVPTLTPSQVPVVTEQPNQSKVAEPVAQPLVQSVCVTPMVQLMIRLPDGQTMPVQFPVMAPAAAPAPSVAPAQAATPIVPQITSTSVAKMKLKEVLTMNQKSVNNGKRNAAIKTKKPQHQILPDSLDNFGLNLSPPSSPNLSQRPGHCGRKRRETVSDDPDEKRKRSLERNRAAATRCREKRKQWIIALGEKADELARTNTQLQQEVTQLRNEVAHLKTMLLAHKDCPVTLQQKASGYEVDKEAYTIRIITSSSDDVQRVPNSESVVSPLNADFMEMEVSSVQSSSDASLTSDASETSSRER